ncbi:MAG: phosphoribosylformylglycinamidine cyclo-ligase [Anaplasma sp.]
MSRYSDAGVDISAANKLVETIKPLAESTRNSGVASGIGGFGALFDPFSDTSYTSPMLVSSTDGVGTKLLVAQEVGKHESIGIDLVAMCVNDILAQGAKPLFFLDYFATGSLERDTALQVISGIAHGCSLANVALIGGETAEMPDMYPKGRYDLAGFSVGIVEKNEVLPRTDQLRAGDLIIGLASSGLHSNGFSLVRKILRDLDIDYRGACPFTDSTWADVLLEPTRIYINSVLPVLPAVKAIAHITGGGFVHNIPRVLPEHLTAEIQLNAWKAHPVFSWLEEEAAVPKKEMFETFNCGIGMILITEEDAASELARKLQQHNESAYVIGKLVQRQSDGVVVLG